MKKIFILLSLCIITFLTSCVREQEGNCNETIDVYNTGEVEYVKIKGAFCDYNYKKIVVEGHDYYFREWTTKNDYGSDLVHNPNCKACRLWKR